MGSPTAKRSDGFTLIELLVVLAVLGILAVTVFPLAEITVQRERERELKRALWEIRDGIDAYKRASDRGAITPPANSSGYPPSLATLAKGVASAKAGGQTVYFLRRVPRDPFADESLADEATWALRSYASSPQKPQAGGDVFDVASQSEKIGLNGIPLKQW